MLSFSKIKNPNKLNSTDTLTFGTYIGKTVEEVMLSSPNYLRWLNNNTDIEFSEYILETLYKKTEECPPSVDDLFDDIPF